MAKNLFEDVDQLFEETTWTSETETVGLKIPGFIKKIEKKKTVNSPKFMLSGVEFCIRVVPGYDGSEFIRVSVVNCSKENQTTSVTFLEGSGAQSGWEMMEIRANRNRGFPEFLSHQKLKTWAKKHGDVFKLKVTVTLHKKVNTTGDSWIRSKPGLEVPKSLRSDASIPALTKTIMLDEETSDFTVRCETKEFKVHKSFLCSRSPVLRAMILGKMKEAQKNEVFIEDIDAKSLAMMISFIYTGDFEVSNNTDVQMTARAADKYDIKGFLELLCFKMKTIANIKNEFIADMLITADRHNSRELRAVAMDKLRANRNILKEAGFRKRMKKAENQDLLFDLFNDL